MDCEKFDQHVMDALYDELDELTHAAMKRHTEGCTRCATAFAGLRAARDVGVLPIEEPSDDLEARILEAVAVAQKKTPLRRKALRALAWAGSHAMRPQLAMAAVFVLVIGSSLLLLRAKPGTVGVAPVRVTERGMPAPEQVEPSPPITEEPLEGPAPAAPPIEAAEAKRADEAATKDKASAAREEGTPEPTTAALDDAQALKKKSGCDAALAKLDEMGGRAAGTPSAHAAMWEAAQCYRAAGDDAKARELLLALRSADGYEAQAEEALAGVEANTNMQMQNAAPGGGAGHQTAAAAPARRAAAKPAAAPPAAAAEAPAPPQSSAPAGQGMGAPMKRDAAY